MKVLLAHNHYILPGGEDLVFETERRLLESRGIAVVEYVERNARIDSMNPLRLAMATLWNSDHYERLRELIRLERPDVAHFHNTFPLLSPAVYYAARAEDVAVVQTLHNYRIMCANSMFYRDERICEDCLGRSVGWPGFVHACYRGSRLQSAGVISLQTVHRALSTWSTKVDAYIALTEFARDKFIRGGLPPERVYVKPHFLYPDPGVGEGKGGYALFVGRLSPEKGLEALLEAWEELDVPLRIVGDGPLSGLVREAEARLDSVEWCGLKPRSEVLDLMGEASVLVVPSEVYEAFGLVIIEAFAKGTPVAVSNQGSIAELVDDGRTGINFQAGDPVDIARRVGGLLADPERLLGMRREARGEYLARYTAEKNLELLMDIYGGARSTASAGRLSPS